MKRVTHLLSVLVSLSMSAFREVRAKGSPHSNEHPYPHDFISGTTKRSDCPHTPGHSYHGLLPSICRVFNFAARKERRGPRNENEGAFLDCSVVAEKALETIICIADGFIAKWINVETFSRSVSRVFNWHSVRMSSTGTMLVEVTKGHIKKVVAKRTRSMGHTATCCPVRSSYSRGWINSTA